MTVYLGQSRRRLQLNLRPTLRLRLTLLNGILLVGAGAILVLLAWLLVGDAMHPVDALQHGSTVTLTDGSTRDALTWQTGLVHRASREVLVKGLVALLAIGIIGIAGGYSGADDEVAELARTFDAMLDRLAGAFESQKRFVANASHELRTPLAVMRTEIDVTLSDDEADLAEYRRMAQVVRNASERANGLVDALLVLARSEAQSGRRLVRKVPADLATSVYNALSAVRAEAERLKLDVTTDLQPAHVVGDPSLLDRLAGNLIENAIRYNHLLGKLWLRTESVDGQARLIVGNTGYEVEQGDVPGLFEPFRRGGWERTGSRGSGLGLSIVRAVCDAHGGTVSAVAQEGGGLEVTVALPTADTTPVVAASASVPRAKNLGVAASGS
jgi:signal transduction histidine kinase